MAQSSSAYSSWSISGKVAMVTGANCGIGKYTALELAKRGARRVILACRSSQRAEEAVVDIRSQIGSDVDCELVVRIVDLSSFDSIRKFAENICQTEDQLDVLVNNAGFLQQDNALEKTGDGFEMTFQINFLGPFLLTNLLIGLMKKSKSARIVNVTSQAYQAAFPKGFDLDDVNQEEYVRKHHSFSYWRAYSQSKLAIILFTRHLHKMLNGDSELSQVSVFSLHPGEIRTNITRHHRINFIKVWLKFLGTDLENGGGDVPAYCACEPGLENRSGEYFNKTCRVEKPFKIAKDERKAKLLCEKAAEWTQCSLDAFSSQPEI